MDPSDQDRFAADEVAPNVDRSGHARARRALGSLYFPILQRGEFDVVLSSRADKILRTSKELHLRSIRRKFGEPPERSDFASKHPQAFRRRVRFRIDQQGGEGRAKRSDNARRGHLCKGDFTSRCGNGLGISRVSCRHQGRPARPRSRSVKVHSRGEQFINHLSGAFDSGDREQRGIIRNSKQSGLGRRQNRGQRGCIS